MIRLKGSQAGFSTIFIVAIAVLAVVAAGTVGVMVYHSDKTANKPISATTTNPSQPAPKSTTSSTNQPAATATQYLDITQWGVELPLSSSISDAYYVVPTGISPNQDGKPSGVILGLTSLNNSCGTVTADAKGYSNNLGEIVRALPTDKDPVSGELYTTLDPDGTTIGGYYYAYTGGITSKTCASSSSLQSVSSAFATAVQNATVMPSSSSTSN